MHPVIPVPTPLSLPSIPGIVSSRCEGHPALIHEVARGVPALPDAVYGKPLEIEANPSAAANLKYMVWACWLPPGTLLQPRLAALCRWLQAIPETRKESPLLVIAKAQGQWDLGTEFRPQLDALLHELDPLQTANGRVLMHVDLPGVALRDTLAKGLEWFFASIDPSRPVSLPPATMLLRSGRTSVARPCGIAGNVVLDTTDELSGRHQRIRMALPAELGASVVLRGALIWGGWRGGGHAERVLTLGAHAGKAALPKVQLSETGGRAARERFRAALRDLIGGGEGFPGIEFADRLWHRSCRSVEREMVRRYANGREQWTPYTEILRREEPDVTLARVAEPLRDGDPPPLAGGPSTPEFPSLLPNAREQCEIQLAVAIPAPEEDPEACRRETGEGREQEKESFRRRRETAAMMERMLRLLLPRGCREEEQSVLRAHLAIEREFPFADALLRKALGIRGDNHEFSRRVKEQFGSCAALRLELEATLDAGGAGWWVRAANAHRRRPHRDAASLAIQRFLRAWVPLYARETPEDYQRRAVAKAMLVYEASAAQLPDDGADMVSDPREDAVLRKLIGSAKRPLLRFMPQWTRLCKWARVQPWADGHLELREFVIDSVSERPGALRHLMVEEAYLCDAIGRLLRTMGKVACGGHYPRMRQECFVRRQARQLAKRIHLASMRILPHEKADALGPFALLAGLAAALDGVCSITWRTTLQGIGATGEPEGDPMVAMSEAASAGADAPWGAANPERSRADTHLRDLPDSDRTNAA